ncbi:MAG: hypothetical protein F083_2564 [bacterium F083]|nr:MAG: hypothetical protein F083_2564 [bacterium F083]
MDKRTIVCKVRLTPEEHDLFQGKAQGYGNVSAMIRDAVRQFNDLGTIRRLEALNEMTALFRKYQQDLSWLGGNFNQSMKRANELAIGHELRQEYYDQVILPQVRHILTFLEDIKAEQQLIVQKLIKHPSAT